MNILLRAGCEPRRWFLVVRMSVFVSLILISFVLQQPESILFGAVLSGLYAIRFVHSSKIRASTILIVCLFYICCMPAFVSMNHGLSPIFYFFSTLSVFFAAKRFCDHSPDELLACFRGVYALSALGIGVVLFLYWDHPEPFGEVIPGSSTNGIPSYLIVLQVTLTISTFLARRNLPLVSPLFTLIVAYFGLGRGSLIISALIFSASILGNLLLGKFSAVQRLLILICLLVGTIFFAQNMVFLLDLLVDGTKLREGLVDPYRMEIFSQYVAGINGWSLIAGSEYSGTVIATLYEGNPHISLIRTHAYFGVFVLLAAVLSPVLILVSNRSLVDRVVVVVFIGFAFLRSLSEPILFPTLLDFFYFCCFFIFFNYAARRGYVVKRCPSCVGA